MQAYLEGATALSISPNHTAMQLKSILTMLSRSARSSTALTSLTVNCDVTTSSTAALLSNVLFHHTSLRTLTLPRLAVAAPDGSHPAATVLCALPCLSRLSFLSLCCPWPTSPATGALQHTVHTLASAIRGLPKLKKFTLEYLHRSAIDPPSPLSPANSGKVSTARILSDSIPQQPASLDPLIAALSTAPALTSLSLSLATTRSLQPLPCSGVHGRFRTLRHLFLDYTNTSSAVLADDPFADTAAILPIPITPLPSLTALRVCGDEDQVARGLIPAFLRVAASQQRLRHAYFTVVHRPDTAGTAMHVDIASRQMDAERLRPVSTMAVTINPMITQTAYSVRAVADAIAQRTALTSLSLKLVASASQGAGGAGGDRGIVSVLGVLRPMSTLGGLLELQVTCKRLGDSCGAMLASIDTMHAMLKAPLASFTQLTHLSLMHAHGSDRMIQASLLVEQLSGLTTLQSLRVGMCHEGVHEVHACLRPLTRLTYLSLDARPVDAALIRCIAGCAGSMAHLARLAISSSVCVAPGLQCSDVDNASADWIHALPHLPSRGQYAFYLHNRAIQEHDYNDVVQRLNDLGATVADRCTELIFWDGH